MQNQNQNQNAEKLSITLPHEMACAIRAKVSAGVYGSNSEVIREALRGWMERERRLQTLDAAVARGLADADARRVGEIDDARAKLRTHLESSTAPT